MLRIASSWKKQQQEPGNKVNAVATASDIKVATALTHGDYAGPSQDLTKTENAQHKGASEDVLKVSSDASASASEQKSAELPLASSWKKQQQESGNKVNAVATASASDIKVATALTHDNYAWPSQDLTKTQKAQHKGANEGVLKVPSDASASEQKIPPTTSSAKPMLPNIAIDTSMEFSFPVSAPSSEPPTPTFKSAELPLASSWKKQLQESGNKVNAVATASASGIKVATALTHGNYAWPSQDLTKTQKAQHKGANEGVLKVPSDASASEQKILPRTCSEKPMLPDIAIDNSMGFSFPVIAPSSDPPTPTFKSTFSVVGQSEGSSVPSCSFPWTSSGSIQHIPPVPDIVVCLLKKSQVFKCLICTIA
ncbi:flocculation protein FLO11-like [Euphorbia lathyris]|uniref:flocculation protein FLO11-like n=1 Tax=Euphorbia lathyris TaxID=212925 RepID=UPI003313F129